MVRTRGPSSLSLSKRQLEAGGDVFVGAGARRERWRRILIGGLGIVMIFAACGLYRILSAPGSSTHTASQPVRVRCEQCGHIATVQAPLLQDYPMRCRHCGKLGARPLLRCGDCGSEFATADPDAEAHCPECGSVRVGSAAVP